MLLPLAACGGGGGEGGAPRPGGADANNAVLLQGRELWVSYCVRCHGPEGEGGAGLRLADGAVVARFPNIEDEIAVVRSGRAGMPAFEGQLSSDEIEAVVRYTREVL